MKKYLSWILFILFAFTTTFAAFRTAQRSTYDMIAKRFLFTSDWTSGGTSVLDINSGWNTIVYWRIMNSGWVDYIFWSWTNDKLCIWTGGWVSCQTDMITWLVESDPIWNSESWDYILWTSVSTDTSWWSSDILVMSQNAVSWFVNSKAFLLSWNNIITGDTIYNWSISVSWDFIITWDAVFNWDVYYTLNTYYSWDTIYTGTTTYNWDTYYIWNSYFSGNNVYTGTNTYNSYTYFNEDLFILGNIIQTGDIYLVWNVYFSGNNIYTGTNYYFWDNYTYWNTYLSWNLVVTGSITDWAGNLYITWYTETDPIFMANSWNYAVLVWNNNFSWTQNITWQLLVNWEIVVDWYTLEQTINNIISSDAYIAWRSPDYFTVLYDFESTNSKFSTDNMWYIPFVTANTLTLRDPWGTNSFWLVSQSRACAWLWITDCQSAMVYSWNVWVYSSTSKKLWKASIYTDISNATNWNTWIIFSWYSMPASSYIVGVDANNRIWFTQTNTWLVMFYDMWTYLLYDETLYFDTTLSTAFLGNYWIGYLSWSKPYLSSLTWSLIKFKDVSGTQVRGTHNKLYLTNADLCISFY